jgi:hypothetical protein
MGDVKERARHGAKARDLETHARKRFDVRFDVDWTPEAQLAHYLAVLDRLRVEAEP